MSTLPPATVAVTADAGYKSTFSGGGGVRPASAVTSQEAGPRRLRRAEEEARWRAFVLGTS
jgi:hypothetical protein